MIGPSLTKATGFAVRFGEADLMLAVEQLRPEALLAQLLEERLQILRPVEVAEGLDEASAMEVGQRRGIVGGRASR